PLVEGPRHGGVSAGRAAGHARVIPHQLSRGGGHRRIPAACRSNRRRAPRRPGALWFPGSAGQRPAGNGLCADRSLSETALGRSDKETKMSGFSYLAIALALALASAAA